MVVTHEMNFAKEVSAWCSSTAVIVENTPDKFFTDPGTRGLEVP
jgi:ABC-type polar amino acid transport system ATPase subunit